MSIEVTMRRGGGAVEVLEELSAIHRVEFTELAHRAFNGESSQSRIVFDDDNGEVASDLNLPVGLTKIQMSAHNVIVVTETATTPPTVIGRGRYASKTVKRADHAIGRARQVEITMDDANMHLRGGAFLEPEERPAETDVERMTWLLGAYLQGSPRLTTDLTSRIVDDDPVTMPAHTYDAGTQPVDLMNDCIRASNKIGFVTVDDELYYAPVGDTSYMAGMRISDREDEHSFESNCTPDVFAPSAALGAAATLDPVNYAAHTPIGSGPNVERVQLTLSQSVAAGQSIVVITTQRGSGANAKQVWDSADNTYSMVAEHTDGSGNAYPRVWYTNVTVALSAGDKITYEIDVGTGTGSLERGGKALTAFLFDGTLASGVESGTGAAFGAAPAVTVGAGDLLIAAIAWKGGASGFPDSFTPDGDWTAFDDTQTAANGADSQALLGGLRVADADGEAWSGSIDQNRDWVTVGAIFTTGTAEEGEGLPTFPPIAPTSIEEGQELISGGVMRFGGGQHVSEVRPSIGDEYDRWVETVNEEGVETEADAVARLAKIIDEQQYEGRTYDVGVLLRNDQVCLVKPGQMIWIKARAIPDADDQFALRRIAELRRAWAGPGHYMHIFKLDRPLRAGRRTPGGGDNGAKALATKPSTAAQMPYDGSGSGSSASTVQEAIEEVAGLAAPASLPHLLTAITFPIVAHRADMNPVDGYPEDTLEAIRQACTRGAHGVEIDVCFDADGVLQVMHDLTVDRTTDGTGTVASKTTAQMAALNIDGGHGHDAGRHGTSLNVPTGAQALDVMLPYDVVIYWDLKDSSDAAHVALAQFIIDNDIVARSVLLGLTVSGLAAAHAIAPTLEMQIPAVVDDDPQNYSYIDRVLTEQAAVTNAAYVNTRNPDPVDSYIDADAHYGDDETAYLTAMWERGVRAYLTNDLPGALGLRNEIVFGIQSTAPATSIQTADVPNAEAEIQYSTATEKIGVYDGQRVRTVGAAGWTPWAGPLIFEASAAFVSNETLAAAGGSLAVPIKVDGHMLLQDVGVRNRDTSLARSWEWRLYEQYLNNGNAGENTLTEVAGANGSESFTAAAISTRLSTATGAPVYLAPGIYWLVIRNTHATNSFLVAVNAMSAEYAPSLYQLKTLGSALSSTLDFVAATWTKVSQFPALRLRGRVFGQTTNF